MVCFAVCIGALADPSAVLTRAQAAGVDSLRREAQRIEQRLEDTADEIALLAEDRLEARERIAKLRSDAADAEREMGDVSSVISSRERSLMQRAMVLYTGGSGSVSGIDLGQSLSANVNRDVYREVNSGVQRDALEQMRAAQEDLGIRRRRLTRLQDEARTEEAILRKKEARATQLEAEQTKLLAQTKGRLGAAIEAERKRREAEEAARERARIAAAERAARERARRAATAAERRRAQAEEARLSERLRRSTRSGSSARDSGRDLAAGLDTPASSPSAVIDEAPAAPGGARAVQVALSQVGKPYIWGATGPNGYDCSGLMLMAWRAAGKQLPRVSRAQYAGTRRVAISDLQPGDLVFFAKPGRAIHHVGMYIGNGQMVEASRRGYPVRTRSIFRRDLIGAGRP
jgi:peptidoglycan DL-endopeptidase CwlO